MATPVQAPPVETLPVEAPPDQAPPEAFYLGSLAAYWQHLTVRAAAEMALADHLKDGPLSLEELAAKAQAHPSAVYRVMRALSNAGIFEETSPRTFALNPISQLLRSDTPNSFRSMVLAEFEIERVPAWHALPHAIRTGEIAYDHVAGKDIWQYYRENPEAGERFADWMTECTRVSNQAIFEAFDFSPYPTVVDIGGGQGHFLEGLLERYPDSQGILLDQPAVVAQAPELPRLRRVGGNFFESVPPGGDLYTIKWVIHDWEESKAIAILRNIRRAMKPGSRLLLIEALLKENPGPDFAKWLDINMLVMTGGEERTEKEYCALLNEAGFKLERVVPTAGIGTLLLASQA